MFGQAETLLASPAEAESSFCRAVNISLPSVVAGWEWHFTAALARYEVLYECDIVPRFSPVPMLRRRPATSFNKAAPPPSTCSHWSDAAHSWMPLFLQNRSVTGPVAVIGGTLKSTLWSCCPQFQSRARWPDYENRDVPLWRINSLCSVSIWSVLGLQMMHSVIHECSNQSWLIWL